MILLSYALELNVKKNIKINKLFIDAAKEYIFLMMISNIGVYNITHTNSKTNYEKLIILINDFLQLNNLHINDISFLYVNRGPGSFAGIRNSLSIIKALHLIKKIDYYCYSIEDFKGEDNIKHENIPDLCDKFKVKKNLIKPIYIS